MCGSRIYHYGYDELHQLYEVRPHRTTFLQLCDEYGCAYCTFKNMMPHYSRSLMMEYSVQPPITARVPTTPSPNSAT
jgi:hypothetical protein